VLELAGVEVPAGMRGRSLLDPGPRSPLVSATFGGGPLRWAWRDGQQKVILHMAAQPGVEGASRTRAREERPLPSGAWQFDLGSDPAERRPGEIAPRLMSPVGEAFAASAGRLVPGLQLMGWGIGGRLEAALRLPGQLEVVQVWSTAPVELSRTGEKLSVACERSDPVCALSMRVEPDPGWVEVLGAAVPWVGVTGREQPETLDPPAEITPGVHLWWNPDRQLVVGGHEETLRRLRALGYIE
jgi:hypothetical protein